jgi:hypothetical protein
VNFVAALSRELPSAVMVIRSLCNYQLITDTMKTPPRDARMSTRVGNCLVAAGAPVNFTNLQ